MTPDDLPSTALDGAVRLSTLTAEPVAAAAVLRSPLRDAGEVERSLLQEKLARAKHRLNAGAPGSGIPRCDLSQPVPLSLAQEGLWFLDQLEPGNPAYNVCQGAMAEGPLDVLALERALNEIVARHAALRTNFTLRDGRPVQIVSPSRELEMQLIDGEREYAADAEWLPQRLREAAQAPFNLESDLLIRAVLIRCSPTRHAIGLTMHHIVSDGWSVGVLFQELAALYRRTATSNAPAALPIQFADYAVWERQALSGRALEKLVEFWKTELAGSPHSIELPYDFTPGSTSSRRGGVETLELPLELTQALKRLGQREGATLFMTLLAAFDTLLYRWTGQSDFAVGSIVAGRRKVEVEPLIGYFVNTVVFRANTAGSPTFLELLGRVREKAFGVLAHQELPFERLVQELRPDRSGGRHPIFQVLFVLQSAPMAPVALGDVQLQPVEVDTATAKFDLTLSVMEHAGGLRAAIEYNAELFAPATIQRLLRSFETLLQGITTNPRQKITTLPIVPSDELQRMLVDWNATALPYDRDLCVHEAFDRQVQRTPHAVALTWRGQSWTYARLQSEADQLALVLRAHRVGPETLVGLYLHRTPQLLVAMLAILKAGGAYVPLDPAYPEERLRAIADDSGIAVLVTEQALARKFAGGNTRLVLVDHPDRRSVRALDQIAAAPKPQASNVAYVIYTSGSTGRPKGVCVLHRNVMALVAWAKQLYSADELSGVFFSTSACFDVSVFESLVPLCLGGRLIVGENLLELSAPPVTAERVTLVSGVPSAMVEVVRARLMPKTVRTVNLAGEACPQSLVDAIYALGHVERVYDVYGPTETTVYSVGGLRVAGGKPTIGRPLPNERVYVLDANLQPVPQGLRGELFIGGEKVARGYLNRPELTAERFVTAPWSAQERLYRTGDGVRWLPDGTLEYLGRLDRQVKIRGFRIEPGEIEAVLKQHPAVSQSAVVPREDARLGKSLAAYVVPHPGAAVAPEELRAFLEQRLPAFLIPASFTAIDRLPLSPNGKLDVRALTALGQPTTEARRDYVSPRDAIEQKLVGVWEQVLDQRPIGVTHDFFDLGGHSLLAVRMTAEIERTLGHKVPVSILFRAPTIERLARAIREEGLVAPGTSLIDIQPGGTRAPMYWLHTLGGGAGAGLFTYQKLARYLGPDQPSFGFVSPGGEPDTFEALAAQYVAELRAVQPEGPYNLGGYCFGGVLAYEMARQLAAVGAEVGWVVLLDSFPPHPPGLPGKLSPTFLRHVLRTGPGWLGDALRDPRELLQRGRKVLARLLRRQPEPASGAEPVPRGQRITDFVNMDRYPSEFRAHAEAHWAAMMRYHPQPFPGRLVLFRTTRRRLLTYPAEYQWRKLARTVDVHVVSGTHENILDDPQVGQVAGVLRRLLEQRR